jgi:hypothetical protein
MIELIDGMLIAITAMMIAIVILLCTLVCIATWYPTDVRVKINQARTTIPEVVPEGHT